MCIQTYGSWKPAAFYPIITRGFPNYPFVAFAKLFYVCMGISVFSWANIYPSLSPRFLQGGRNIWNDNSEKYIREKGGVWERPTLVVYEVQSSACGNSNKILLFLVLRFSADSD
jgi:hypothetical protein